MINPQEASLGIPGVPTAIGPTETLQVEDEAPSQTEETLDVSPAPAPIPREEAQRQATEAHLGLGERSPGIQTLASTIEVNGSQGYRDYHASLAQIDAQTTRLRAAESYLRSLKGPPTKEDAEIIRSIAQTGLGPTSHTVWERGFATFFMNSLVGRFLGMEGENAIKEALQKDNDNTLDIINRGEDMMVSMKGAQVLRSELEAERAETTGGAKLYDFGKQLLPFYSTWVAGKVDPNNSYLTPGSARMERIQQLHLMPPEKAIAQLRSDVDILKQYSLLEAIQYVSDFMNYTLGDRTMGNIFGGLDIVTAPGVGLAVKGAKSGIKALRGVDAAEAAARTSGALNAEEALAKATAGKSIPEKIGDTVWRAVNAATGTKEVNATSVAAAVGDNAAVAGIEWAKEPARVRGIREMENVLPTLMFPQAGVRIGVNKGGELIRRLTDEAIYRRDRLMQIFREAATIDRMPASARAIGFKETMEYLQKQYTSVHDAVLDMTYEKIPFIKTKEIPGERTYGNVDRVVVYMGKPDGQWFDTKVEAMRWAQEHYNIPAKGYAIADEGGKYAISVVKTVDETSPTVREALRIATDNKTPTPGLLGMLIPSFLRTADDQVSEFARQTRKQAVYGLQAIQKNIAEIAKPIGKLSRDEARKLKEVLEGNRLYHDEQKAVYGKWHQTVKELEQDYIDRFGRPPSEKEINAYYAYVALNDFDYISRNMTIYRDKSRQGIMNGSYHFDKLNADGTRTASTLNAELKPVERLPFENQEDWTIWINPMGTETFDPKSIKSHKRDLLGEDRATIDEMLKNGYKIYQVANPEATPFKPITGERVVNFVISKDITLENLSAKQIPYKAGGHFEYANSWFVKQPIIARGAIEKQDPYNFVAFHGTKADFEKFSEETLGSNTGAPSAKKGFFFSKSPSTAEAYTKDYWEGFHKAMDEDSGEIYYEGLSAEHKIRYNELYAPIKEAENELEILSIRNNETPPGHPDYDLVGKLIEENYAKNRKHQEAFEAFRQEVKKDPQYFTGEFDNNANIRPVKLRMENPYVHDFRGAEYRDKAYNDIIREAKANGHDGVILKNTYDGGPQDDIYVVFKPDQIASKFENTEVVSAKEHIYKGDQTIFSFSSEAQAKKFAERMEKARQLLKEGKTDDLANYLNKNLPFNYSQFKGLFESYIKDGEVIPARLNIDDPIRHVYTKERMTDRYSDLPTMYENFQDTIRSSYNLWNEIDKKYAGMRDPPLWTVRENTENGKEIFKLDTADMIDPMATMNRAVASVMRNSMMADYKISAVESWVSEFGHLLKSVTPESLRNNPAQILYNNEITKNIEQQDIRRAAEASRQAIVRLLGSASEIEETASWIKRKLTSDVYERMGAKYADVLEANPIFSQDPTRAVRATAFHLKLGMFNPTQYLIQAQTLTHIMALAGPGTGMKSLAAGQLMRTFVNHLDNPAYMDHISKIAGRMGYDPKMFRESFEEMRRSGIFHVEGEHSWKEDLIDQHIITTKSGQFLDTATFFFKEGERLPRLTAWNAAFMEWRMANPEAVVDNAVRRKIVDRANTMTVNMTRDANAAWQQGIWSIPTQFMSYQARLMEQMLGTRLTTVEKARLFTAYSMMYGVPSAATLYFPWPLQEEFRQKAISYGYNPDQAGAFVSAIANGLPGFTLSLVTGTDYNMSERYGPGGFSVIRDLVYGDKNLGEVLFGPANEIIGDVFKSMDPLLGAAKAALSNDPNTSYSATVEDLIAATQNISSVNNAVKMVWALNTGTWISKNNIKLSQVTNFDAVWMGITGMSTRDLSDVFLMTRETKQFENAKKAAEKEIGIAWRRALQAAANDDYDQYRNYLKRANAFFVAGGFQEKDRAGVYQRAMQMNQDLASKIRQDFWLKAPKDLVKPRYDMWINQNKVTN